MKNEKLVSSMVCLALPTVIFLVIDGCFSASPIIFEDAATKQKEEMAAQFLEDIFGTADRITADLKRKHAQDMRDIELYYQYGIER